MVRWVGGGGTEIGGIINLFWWDGEWVSVNNPGDFLCDWGEGCGARVCPVVPQVIRGQETIWVEPMWLTDCLAPHLKVNRCMKYYYANRKVQVKKEFNWYHQVKRNLIDLIGKERIKEWLFFQRSFHNFSIFTCFQNCLHKCQDFKE